MSNNFPNLTIESLFSGPNGARPSFVGRIDVETLFKQEKDNFQFDSKILLDGIYKKRKNLQECYSNIYKRCCETIMSANKSGFTHIIYEIPVYSECIGYNCAECIDFLKNDLEKQNLNVIKLSNIKIKINWNDLENKVKNSNNQQFGDAKSVFNGWR